MNVNKGNEQKIKSYQLEYKLNESIKNCCISNSSMTVQSRTDIEQQSGICHWKFVSKSRDMTSLIIDNWGPKLGKFDFERVLSLLLGKIGRLFWKKTLATFHIVLVQKQWMFSDLRWFVILHRKEIELCTVYTTDKQCIKENLINMHQVF